jgi:hypothetical protein
MDGLVLWEKVHAGPQKSQYWAPSMMQQRKILVAAAAAVSDGELVHPKSLYVTKVERLEGRSATCGVPAKDGGKIFIRAANCSYPTKPTDDVLFMASFLGGKQLHLRSDIAAEHSWR